MKVLFTLRRDRTITRERREDKTVAVIAPGKGQSGCLFACLLLPLCAQLAAIRALGRESRERINVKWLQFSRHTPSRVVEQELAKKSV